MANKYVDQGNQGVHLNHSKQLNPAIAENTQFLPTLGTSIKSMKTQSVVIKELAPSPVRQLHMIDKQNSR